MNQLLNWWWNDNVEYPLGVIYSASSWSDLSNWTVQGVVTPVASGGTINFSGGTAVYTNTLNLLSPYTCLENYSIVAQIKITGGGTNGWNIGIKSYNGSSAHSIFYFYSGGNIGISAGNPVAIRSTTPALASSVNDIIELTASKVGQVATVSARNVTTGGATVTTSYTFSMTAVVEPLTPNTGRFCIGTFGSTFSVLSYIVSSTVKKRARLCIIGDSITEGYAPDTYAHGYARLLNANFPTTIIHAAENDRTAEVLLRIPQLLTLNPRRALLAIGVNDVATSVPSATYNANIDSIYSQLTAANILVTFLLPYSTTLDLSTLKTHIITTYPGKYIDPGTSGAGNFIGDGYHYNATGNAAVAAAVVAASSLI